MYTRHLKMMAGVLTLAFSLQQLAIAAPNLNKFTQVTDIPSLNSLQLSFDLPESIALIEDVYKAPNANKTIILMQDAHTNESGQLNLAKALDLILQKESIEYVFTEAAKGEASLSYLKSEVDESTRLEVSRSLLRKGLLHGAEYLSLTGSRDFSIWGVEDRGLYDQGLLLYEKITRNRKDALMYLSKISRTATTLKTRLFTDDLREFDDLKNQYYAEKINITDYFGQLQKIAQKHAVTIKNLKALHVLRKLKAIEAKIDFKSASKEQNQIMQQLNPTDQQLMQDFLNRDAQKIKGKRDLTSVAFYALLREKTKANIDAYPNLKAYLHYIEQSQELNAQSVLDELVILEEKIANRLIRNSNQKMLYAVSTNAALLKQLFELKITPAEFALYTKNKIYFNSKVMVGFLNKQIMDLDKHYDLTIQLNPTFETSVSQIEEFYQLTYARDLVFVKNIESKMESASQSKAVVITGGYHAPNLKALLKSKGISFVSLMPQILHETNYDRYEHLLLGQLNQAISIEKNTAKGAIQWMTLHTQEPQSLVSSPALTTFELRQALDLSTAPIKGVRMAKPEGLLKPSASELPAEIRKTINTIYNLLPVTLKGGVLPNTSYRKPAEKAKLIQGRTQWRLIIKAIRQMTDLAYSLKATGDAIEQDTTDYPGKKVAIEYFEGYAQILINQIKVNTNKLKKLLKSRESRSGISETSVPEEELEKEIEAGLAEKWLDQGRRIQGQVRGEITREFESLMRNASNQDQARQEFENSLNARLQSILEEMVQSIYREYLVELAFETDDKSDEVTKFLLAIARTKKKAGAIDGGTMYRRIVGDVLTGSEFQNSRIEEIIADSADFIDLFLEFGDVKNRGNKSISTLRRELVDQIKSINTPGQVLKGREYLLVSDVHASSYGINTLRLYAPGAKPIIVGDLVDRGHELEEVIKSTKRFTLADHDLWALGAAFGDPVLTAHWMRSNYRDNNRSILVQLGIDLSPMDVLAKKYLEKEWLSSRVDSTLSDAELIKEADKRIKAKKKIKDAKGVENLKRSFNNVHEVAAANIWLKLWAKSEWEKKQLGVTWNIEPFRILAHADGDILLLKKKYSKAEMEILRELRTVSKIKAKTLSLDSLAKKWELTPDEDKALELMQLQFLNSQKMRDLAEYLLRFGKVYEVLGQSALLESIDQSRGKKAKGLAQNKALLLHSVFPVNRNGKPVNLAGKGIEFADLQTTLDGYQDELDLMAQQWEKLVSKKVIDAKDLKDYSITVKKSFEFVRDLADGINSPLYARAQRRGDHMYIRPVEEVDNLAYVLWEENVQSNAKSKADDKKDKYVFSSTQKDSLKDIYGLVKTDFVRVGDDKKEGYQLASPQVNEKIIRFFAESFGVKTIIGGHVSQKDGRIKTSGGESYKFLRIDPYFVDKGGIAAEIPTGLVSGVLFGVNGYREISLPTLKEVLTYAKDAELSPERKKERKKIRSFLLQRITLADISHYELEIQSNDLEFATHLRSELFELLKILKDVTILRKNTTAANVEKQILLDAIKSQPKIDFDQEIIDAKVVRQLLTLAGQPQALANTYLRSDADIDDVVSARMTLSTPEDGIERPEPEILYHRTQLGVSADQNQQIAEAQDMGDLSLFLRAKKSANYQALRKILALKDKEGQDANYSASAGLSEKATDDHIFAEAEKTGRSFAEIVLSMYGDTSFNKSSKFKYGDTTQRPSPEIYPEAIVIGGGTAAAVVVKALKETEFAKGFEASYDARNNVLIPFIASFVPNTDDGGATFKLIKSLRQANYGIIPPLGDQVNALFKSFLDQRKFDQVLDGRIRKFEGEEYNEASSYTQAMSDIVTQNKGFEDAMLVALQWTWAHLRDIGDARKQPRKKGSKKAPKNEPALPKLKIPHDFMFFAANMLTLARVVDKEFKLGTKKPLLDMSGASIRNFVLLGALVDAGALPKGEPLKKGDSPNDESAFKTDASSILYQQALIDLLSATDIQDGISMITSYDPRTLYAKYQHTVLAIRNPKNEKKFHVLKIERQADENNIAKSIIISDVGTDLTAEAKSQKTLGLGDERSYRVFGRKILIGLNVEGKPYIRVNGQQIALVENEDGNLMIEQGEDEFAMSDSGTGLTMAEANAKPPTEEGKKPTKDGVILDELHFFIRPPLTVMQTHMTDNLNLSKVVETGILDEQVLESNSEVDGSVFRAIPPRESQKLKPNLQAIETLNRAQRLIVFGPGSVDTSLMPHLFIPEFVDALAAKKDVKRVFVFNPSLDNETVGYDVNGIIEKIKIITGREFEDLFDVVIVGTNNAEKADKIEREMNLPLDYEFRSPGDASHQAKKARGAFNPLNNDAGDNLLLQLKRDKKIEIFESPMIDIISSQDRKTGKIVDGIGFDPDLLGEVFNKIIKDTKKGKVDPRIFYGDMNAVGDESLKNEQVALVAKAYGTLVRERSHEESPTVVIAGDTRLNTPRIKAAFIAGLRKTGVNVIDLGIAPIGFAYWAQKFLEGVRGGVVISGGSNKPDINGIKLFYDDISLDPNDREWGLPKVDEYISQESFKTGQGSLTQADLTADYRNYVQTYFRTSPERWIKNVVLKQEEGASLRELVRDARAEEREGWQLLRGSTLVLDSGNGAVGSIARDIFESLGAVVISLYEDADGNFPNHIPNPHIAEGLESLIAGVKRHKADFGFAFSGDGQRLGIVDSNRSVVNTDDVLSIFATDAVENYKAAEKAAGIIEDNPPTVVLDRKSLQSLRDALEHEEKARVVLSQVGFAHIRNVGIENKAVFAGETYSQYMFRDGFFAMDAIFAAANFLKIIYQVDTIKSNPKAKGGIKPLRPVQLVGEKYHSIPEVRIPYTFGSNSANITAESVGLNIVRKLIKNAEDQKGLDGLIFEPLKMTGPSKNTTPSERMEWKVKVKKEGVQKAGAKEEEIEKVEAWLRIEASHNHPVISLRAEAKTAVLLEEVLELAWKSLRKYSKYIDLHDLQTLLRKNFGTSREWNSLERDEEQDKEQGQARMTNVASSEVNISDIDEANSTAFLYALTNRILNENYIPHTPQEIQAITQLAAKVADKGFYPVLWDHQHLSIVEVDGALGMVDVKVGSRIIQRFHKDTVLKELKNENSQKRLAVDNVADALLFVRDFKSSMQAADKALNLATQNGQRAFNFGFSVPISQLFNFESIQDAREQQASAEFLLSIMKWASNSNWGQAQRVQFFIADEDMQGLPTAKLKSFWSQAIEQNVFLSSEAIDYASSDYIAVKWLINGQDGNSQAININMSPLGRNQLPQHFLSGVTTALRIFYEVVPEAQTGLVDARAYFNQAQSGLGSLFAEFNDLLTFEFENQTQMLRAVQRGLYAPKQYLRAHVVKINEFLNIMRMAISTTRMAA
ncbi:MAG: phosphomannomutase [Candidatus Omnitrophota bacterium]|jgi:phosphomannomutase